MFERRLALVYLHRYYQGGREGAVTMQLIHNYTPAKTAEDVLNTILKGDITTHFLSDNATIIQYH